jgi:hypothetical protein
VHGTHWLQKKEKSILAWIMKLQKNGWMETDTFKNSFEKNFLKNIPTKRPVILIYDGHSPPLVISLVQKSKQVNLVILKLSPHTRHVLQPMDPSVFRPLILPWVEELFKWHRKNYGSTVTALSTYFSLRTLFSTCYGVSKWSQWICLSLNRSSSLFCNTIFPMLHRSWWSVSLLPGRHY